MISTGFGGALSAVPSGVPVRSRSPASSRWNRLSACSASSGEKIMSPSTTASWRSSPLTHSRRRRSPNRLSSSSSSRTSAGPTGVKVG